MTVCPGDRGLIEHVTPGEDPGPNLCQSVKSVDEKLRRRQIWNPYYAKHGSKTLPNAEVWFSF